MLLIVTKIIKDYGLADPRSTQKEVQSAGKDGRVCIGRGLEVMNISQ